MRETVTLFLAAYCAALLTLPLLSATRETRPPPDAGDQCTAWWPDRNSDEWWVCYVSLETARCEAEGWCSDGPDAEAIVTVPP